MRFHYYLARLLELAWRDRLIGEPEILTEAIREYASAGAASAETTEARMLAHSADLSLLALVLSTTTPKALPETSDIVDRPESTAQLSTAELIGMVEPALRRAKPDWGLWDKPVDRDILLARLHYASGNLSGAWEALKERNWRVDGKDYGCGNGAPKLRFLAHVLEQSGFDPVTLETVRASLRQAETECR